MIDFELDYQDSFNLDVVEQWRCRDRECGTKSFNVQPSKIKIVLAFDGHDESKLRNSVLE